MILKEFNITRVFIYIPRIAEASEKYTSTTQQSSIVVIIGVAISAGSSLHFLASSGSAKPKKFAISIIIIKELDTAPANSQSLY